MSSTIPPSSLGTNIGTINDNGSGLVFEPASARTIFEPTDSIINCSNSTGSSVWIKLEYIYTNEHGEEVTTNQIGYVNDTSVFMVVDVESTDQVSVAVNVYTALGSSGTAPSGDGWTHRGTVTVAGTRAPMAAGSTNVITIEDDGGTPSVSPAYVFHDNTIDSVIIQNNSSTCITVWVNDYSSDSTYDADAKGGRTDPIPMSGAKWQWILGWETEPDGDPQIVLKRPPAYSAK